MVFSSFEILVLFYESASAFNFAGKIIPRFVRDVNNSQKTYAPLRCFCEYTTENACFFLRKRARCKVTVFAKPGPVTVGEGLGPTPIRAFY